MAKEKGKAKKVTQASVRFMPATRGEHIHVRPISGPMKKTDAVVGYAIVGYEYEDERYQETIIVVDGTRIALSEFTKSLPGNKRADVITFPVFEGCCDLNRNRVT